MEDDLLRLAGGAALGQFLQRFQIAPGCAVTFHFGLAGIVENQVGRVDDHVGDFQLTQLFDFRIGELGLHGPSPGEDVNALDIAFLQSLQGVVGDVGCLQFVNRFRQDAGYIHRHIADADHSDTLHAEVELEVAKVGMAVVPGHKLGSGKAALQVFAGNAELLIGLGSNRVDDLIVVRL